MRRSLSFLLAVLMVVSLLPVGAAATEAEVLFSGTNVAASPSAPATHTWTAAANGTLSVTVSGTPGWRFKILTSGGDTLGLPKSNSSGAEKTNTFALTAGETYTFSATGYADWEEAAGTLTYTLRFVADEPDAPVEKDAYAISATTLTVGQNTVAALDTAYTTIFEFEPTETAVYTISTSAGTIGIWGHTKSYLNDPKSTATSVEWTCTGVGQSAFLGITGVEGNVTVTVEKTGSYEVVEIPVVPYENKAVLTPFEKPADATWTGYVDVYGETHTAVLGSDGYYHLDSVDGDILVVNLKYQDIILSAALKSDRPVMYAYMTDEDGNQFKYDIGNALLEYEAVMDANGNYPLTEDLLLFYQVYAMQAGTFTFHLSGNYNEECVWMYCMRTMHLAEAPQPSEPEPSEPETSEPEVTEPETSEPEVTEPEVTEPEPSEPEVTEPSVPSEPVDGEVVLNESVTADSSEKYVYSYKPTEDGTLTITVGDGTTNWTADVVYFAGLSMKTVASASGTAAATFTAEVTAGTTYRIRVYKTTGGALTATPVTAVFKAAGGTEPEQPTEPEVTKDAYAVSTTKLAVGDNAVSMIDTAEATIFKFTPSATGKYTITAPAGTYIGIWGYSTAYLNNPNSTSNILEWECTNVGPSIFVGVLGAEGNISVNVVLSTAEPDPSEPGTDPSEPEVTEPESSEPESSEPESSEPEVVKDAYAVSTTLLAVGDNTVSMIDTAEATIFRFRPTEAGKYTVTSPAGTTIGIWGYSTAYLNNPNSTSNTLEWECTSVGQSIYVGVVGAEGNVLVTVETVAEETEPSESTEPSEPSEPSEPETEPTTPSVPDTPDTDVPAGTYYSITVDGTTTYYSSTNAATLNAALKKITGTGYLKFYQDMELGTNGTLDVYNGNITIDLNGCTITGSFGGAGALYVDGGVVTLMDTSAEGDGLIQNAMANGHGIEIYQTAGSSVTMLSGNVSGGANAAGVKVWANATFNMEGGKVTGGNYGMNALAGSNVTVSGGFLVNTKAVLAYPLYAVGTSTVSVTGGYFSGGAVYGVGLNGAISGGYFVKSVNAAYLAADCELQNNDDATYLYKVYNPNAQPEEPKTPVAQVGDTQYTSLQEALDAAGENGLVVLVGNIEENAEVKTDLYLDLNGFSITGTVTVAEGATLYGVDSTTNDYDCSDGYGSIAEVSGNVALHHKTAATGALGSVLRYLTYTDPETGAVSFHRIYLGITRVTLRPGKSGVGYKAIFGGDEIVKSMLSETAAFGYTLQLEGQQNAKTCSGVREDFVTGNAGTPVSLVISNYDMAYAENTISAYVTLTLTDGTVITSSSYEFSLKSILHKLNEQSEPFTQGQQEGLKTMISSIADKLNAWGFTKLYDIVTAVTEEEN